MIHRQDLGVKYTLSVLPLLNRCHRKEKICQEAVVQVGRNGVEHFFVKTFYNNEK